MIVTDQHFNLSIAEYRVDIKKSELKNEEERLNAEILKELTLDQELSEEYKDKTSVVKVELDKQRIIDEVV